MEDIFDYLFIYFFKRRIIKDDVLSVIGIESNNVIKQVLEKIKNSYGDYMTLGDLKRDVETRTENTFGSNKNTKVVLKLQ